MALHHSTQPESVSSILPLEASSRPAGAKKVPFSAREKPTAAAAPSSSTCSGKENNCDEDMNLFIGKQKCTDENSIEVRTSLNRSPCCESDSCDGSHYGNCSNCQSEIMCQNQSQTQKLEDTNQFKPCIALNDSFEHKALKNTNNLNKGQNNANNEQKDVHASKAVSKHRKSVSFSQVHLREYERIMSDHPCAMDGPPIGIGWRYHQGSSYLVEDYEKTREEKLAKQLREVGEEEEDNGYEEDEEGDFSSEINVSEWLRLEGGHTDDTGSSSDENSSSTSSNEASTNTSRSSVSSNENAKQCSIVTSRPMHPRRSRPKRPVFQPLKGYIRRNMIRYDLGYSDDEIESTLKEVAKIQRQRVRTLRSLRSLPSIQRLQGFQSSFSRNALECIASQRSVRFISSSRGSGGLPQQQGEEEQQHGNGQPQSDQIQIRNRRNKKQGTLGQRSLSRIFRGAVQAVVFAISTLNAARSSITTRNHTEEMTEEGERDIGPDEAATGTEDETWLNERKDQNTAPNGSVAIALADFMQSRNTVQ